MKRRFGTGLLVLVLLFVGGPRASAQSVGGAFDSPSLPGTESDSGGVWLSFPIKAAFMAVGVVLAWTAGFYLVFPGMLRKSKPAWPLEAYGFSAALVWVTIWVLALAIFWQDLVLDLKVGSGVVDEWGLRGVFASVATVGGLLFRGIYRSQRPAANSSR